MGIGNKENRDFESEETLLRGDAAVVRTHAKAHGSEGGCKEIASPGNDQALCTTWAFGSSEKSDTAPA